MNKKLSPYMCDSDKNLKKKERAFVYMLVTIDINHTL